MKYIPKLSIVLVVLATCASATVISLDKLQDKIKQAPNIVIAEANSVKPYWEGKNIYTNYEFTIIENLKGDNSDNTLSVNLFGGRIGKHVSYSPGNTISFMQNRLYLLFFKDNIHSNNPRTTVIFTLPLEKTSTGSFKFNTEDGKYHDINKKVYSFKNFQNLIQKEVRNK